MCRVRSFYSADPITLRKQSVLWGLPRPVQIQAPNLTFAPFSTKHAQHFCTASRNVAAFRRYIEPNSTVGTIIDSHTDDSTSIVSIPKFVFKSMNRDIPEDNESPPDQCAWEAACTAALRQRHGQIGDEESTPIAFQ